MKIDLAPILALDYKDRYNYLRDNKQMLINTKRSTPHTYDMKESIFSLGYEEKASGLATKLKSIPVLVFKTNIMKAYNDKMFMMYNSKSVNQHSIGLQYVQLLMGVNDPQDKEHYKIFMDYIEQAINPQKAYDNGFFFVSKEYKLIENSAVLFGANELTPTLSVEILDENTSQVKVVANAANWIDEQMDMLLPGAPGKSIKQKFGMIPHLQDHVHSTASKLGEVQDITEEIIDLNKYIKAALVAPQKKQFDFDYLIDKITIESPRALDYDYLIKNL
jgi:hypothetical protein